MEKKITLDNAESLLKVKSNRKINGSQFYKRYNNIVHDGVITLGSTKLQETEKNGRNFSTVKRNYYKAFR